MAKNRFIKKINLLFLVLIIFFISGGMVIDSFATVLPNTEINETFIKWDNNLKDRNNQFDLGDRYKSLRGSLGHWITNLNYGQQTIKSTMSQCAYSYDQLEEGLYNIADYKHELAIAYGSWGYDARENEDYIVDELGHKLWVWQLKKCAVGFDIASPVSNTSMPLTIYGMDGYRLDNLNIDSKEGGTILFLHRTPSVMTIFENSRYKWYYDSSEAYMTSSGKLVPSLEGVPAGAMDNDLIDSLVNKNISFMANTFSLTYTTVPHVLGTEGTDDFVASGTNVQLYIEQKEGSSAGSYYAVAMMDETNNQPVPVLLGTGEDYTPFWSFHGANLPDKQDSYIAENNNEIGVNLTRPKYWIFQIGMTYKDTINGVTKTYDKQPFVKLSDIIDSDNSISETSTVSLNNKLVYKPTSKEDIYNAVEHSFVLPVPSQSLGTQTIGLGHRATLEEAIRQMKYPWLVSSVSLALDETITQRNSSVNFMTGLYANNRSDYKPAWGEYDWGQVYLGYGNERKELAGFHNNAGTKNPQLQGYNPLQDYYEYDKADFKGRTILLSFVNDKLGIWITQIHNKEGTNYNDINSYSFKSTGITFTKELSPKKAGKSFKSALNQNYVNTTGDTEYVRMPMDVFSVTITTQPAVTLITDNTCTLDDLNNKTCVCTSVNKTTGVCNNYCTRYETDDKGNQVCAERDTNYYDAKRKVAAFKNIYRSTSVVPGADKYVYGFHSFYSLGRYGENYNTNESVVAMTHKFIENPDENYSSDDLTTPLWSYDKNDDFGTWRWTGITPSGLTYMSSLPFDVEKLSTDAGTLDGKSTKYRVPYPWAQSTRYNGKVTNQTLYTPYYYNKVFNEIIYAKIHETKIDSVYLVRKGINYPRDINENSDNAKFIKSIYDGMLNTFDAYVLDDIGNVFSVKNLIIRANDWGAIGNFTDNADAYTKNTKTDLNDDVIKDSSATALFESRDYRVDYQQAMNVWNSFEQEYCRALTTVKIESDTPVGNGWVAKLDPQIGYIKYQAVCDTDSAPISNEKINFDSNGYYKNSYTALSSAWDKVVPASELGKETSSEWNLTYKEFLSYYFAIFTNVGEFTSDLATGRGVAYRSSTADGKNRNYYQGITSIHGEFSNVYILNEEERLNDKLVYGYINGTTPNYFKNVMTNTLSSDVNVSADNIHDGVSVIVPESRSSDNKTLYDISLGKKYGPELYLLDKTTGKYVNPDEETVSCPAGYVQEGLECVSIFRADRNPICPENYSYEESLRACMRPKTTNLSCPSGYHTFNGTCMSYSGTDEICDSGEEFNESIGSCGTTDEGRCNIGWDYDYENNQCIFKKLKECPFGGELINDICVSSREQYLGIVEENAILYAFIPVYRYLQEFSLPEGRYLLEAWGADGGGTEGGKGGYASGIIEVTEPVTLYANVGQQGVGNKTTSVGGTTSSANYGDGGKGGPATNGYTEVGTGGDSADIRICKPGDTRSICSGLNSLDTRILVAGGGGGSVSYNGITYAGGVGGGYFGEEGVAVNGDTSNAGAGGTPINAGTNAATPAANASSAAGGNGTVAGYAGGGGGFYGGAAGRAGGGGSGFVFSEEIGIPDGYLEGSAYNKYLLSDVRLASGAESYVDNGSSNAYITIKHLRNGDVTCEYVHISEDESVDIQDVYIGETVQFNYSGKCEIFYAKIDGIYFLEAWGAEGGTNLGDNNFGSGLNNRDDLINPSDRSYDVIGATGKGGYSGGFIYLSQGEGIRVCVGGQGENGDRELYNTAKGGFNGGGNATGLGGAGGGMTSFEVLRSDYYEYALVAGGGGGAGIHAKERENIEEDPTEQYTKDDMPGTWDSYSKTGYLQAGQQVKFYVGRYTNLANGTVPWIIGRADTDITEDQVSSSSTWVSNLEKHEVIDSGTINLNSVPVWDDFSSGNVEILNGTLSMVKTITIEKPGYYFIYTNSGKGTDFRYDSVTGYQIFDLTIVLDKSGNAGAGGGANGFDAVVRFDNATTGIGGTKDNYYKIGQGSSSTTGGGGGGGYYGGFGAPNSGGGGGGSGYINDKYITSYRLSDGRVVQPHTRDGAHNKASIRLPNGQMSEGNIGNGFAQISLVETNNYGTEVLYQGTLKANYSFIEEDDIMSNKYSFQVSKSGKTMYYCKIKNDTIENSTNVSETRTYERIFNYTGGGQTIRLNPGVYTIEAWGAQGGNGELATDNIGGKGGYAAGTITIKEPTIITVNVGENPRGIEEGTEGDFVFGGAGVEYYDYDNEEYFFAGGGASDVTINGEKVLIAGGGGGGSRFLGVDIPGGYGGGSTAGKAYYMDANGTIKESKNAAAKQTAPSTTKSDSLSGATYVINPGSKYQGARGSGGGYYGGNTATVTSANGIRVYSGGGGSSYVSSIFKNTQIIAGNKEMPALDGIGTQIGKLEDGAIKITGYEYDTNTNLCDIQDEKAYSKTFTYSSAAAKTVTLKPGRYKLEAWGAQGGSSKGGKGGYSSGEILIEKETTLYIVLGQQPSSANGKGGYNGGGNTYHGGDYGGGGATHIALIDGELKTLEHNLSELLLVAGGGGGGNQFSTSTKAGAGGGYDGIAGYEDKYYEGALGGTQVAGGAPGAGFEFEGQTAGTFGVGGLGYGQDGGGGGGGYYGGGGGLHWGGGGGSGYVSDVLTNGTSIAGNQTFASVSGSTETGHAGHGAVKITGVEFEHDDDCIEGLNNVLYKPFSITYEKACELGFIDDPTNDYLCWKLDHIQCAEDYTWDPLSQLCVKGEKPKGCTSGGQLFNTNNGAEDALTGWRCGYQVNPICEDGYKQVGSYCLSVIPDTVEATTCPNGYIDVGTHCEKRLTRPLNVDSMVAEVRDAKPLSGEDLVVELGQTYSYRNYIGFSPSLTRAIANRKGNLTSSVFFPQVVTNMWLVANEVGYTGCKRDASSSNCEFSASDIALQLPITLSQAKIYSGNNPDLVAGDVLAHTILYYTSNPNAKMSTYPRQIIKTNDSSILDSYLASHLFAYFSYDSNIKSQNSSIQPRYSLVEVVFKIEADGVYIVNRDANGNIPLTIYDAVSTIDWNSSSVIKIPFNEIYKSVTPAQQEYFFEPDEPDADGNPVYKLKTVDDEGDSVIKTIVFVSSIESKGIDVSNKDALSGIINSSFSEVGDSIAASMMVDNRDFSDDNAALVAGFNASVGDVFIDRIEIVDDAGTKIKVFDAMTEQRCSNSNPIGFTTTFASYTYDRLSTISRPTECSIVFDTSSGTIPTVILNKDKNYEVKIYTKYVDDNDVVIDPEVNEHHLKIQHSVDGDSIDLLKYLISEGSYVSSMNISSGKEDRTNIVNGENAVFSYNMGWLPGKTDKYTVSRTLGSINKETLLEDLGNASILEFVDNAHPLLIPINGMRETTEEVNGVYKKGLNGGVYIVEIGEKSKAVNKYSDWDLFTFNYNIGPQPDNSLKFEVECTTKAGVKEVVTEVDESGCKKWDAGKYNNICSVYAVITREDLDNVSSTTGLGWKQTTDRAVELVDKEYDKDAYGTKIKNIGDSVRIHLTDVNMNSNEFYGFAANHGVLYNDFIDPSPVDNFAKTCVAGGRLDYAVSNLIVEPTIIKLDENANPNEVTLTGRVDVKELQGNVNANISLNYELRDPADITKKYVCETTSQACEFGGVSSAAYSSVSFINSDVDETITKCFKIACSLNPDEVANHDLEFVAYINGGNEERNGPRGPEEDEYNNNEISERVHATGTVVYGCKNENRYNNWSILFDFVYRYQTTVVEYPISTGHTIHMSWVDYAVGDERKQLEYTAPIGQNASNNLLGQHGNELRYPSDYMAYKSSEATTKTLCTDYRDGNCWRYELNTTHDITYYRASKAKTAVYTTVKTPNHNSSTNNTNYGAACDTETRSDFGGTASSVIDVMGGTSGSKNYYANVEGTSASDKSDICHGYNSSPKNISSVGGENCTLTTDWWGNKMCANQEMELFTEDAAEADKPTDYINYAYFGTERGEDTTYAYDNLNNYHYGFTIDDGAEGVVTMSQTTKTNKIVLKNVFTQGSENDTTLYAIAGMDTWVQDRTVDMCIFETPYSTSSNKTVKYTCGTNYWKYGTVDGTNKYAGHTDYEGYGVCEPADSSKNTRYCYWNSTTILPENTSSGGLIGSETEWGTTDNPVNTWWDPSGATCYRKHADFDCGSYHSFTVADSRIENSGNGVSATCSWSETASETNRKDWSVTNGCSHTTTVSCDSCCDKYGNNCKRCNCTYTTTYWDRDECSWNWSWSDGYSYGDSDSACSGSCGKTAPSRTVTETMTANGTSSPGWTSGGSSHQGGKHMSYSCGSEDIDTGGYCYETKSDKDSLTISTTRCVLWEKIDYKEIKYVTTSSGTSSIDTRSYNTGDAVSQLYQYKCEVKDITEYPDQFVIKNYNESLTVTFQIKTKGTDWQWVNYKSTSEISPEHKPMAGEYMGMRFITTYSTDRNNEPGDMWFANNYYNNYHNITTVANNAASDAVNSPVAYKHFTKYNESFAEVIANANHGYCNVRIAEPYGCSMTADNDTTYTYDKSNLGPTASSSVPQYKYEYSVPETFIGIELGTDGVNDHTHAQGNNADGVNWVTTTQGDRAKCYIGPDSPRWGSGDSRDTFTVVLEKYLINAYGELGESQEVEQVLNGTEFGTQYQDSASIAITAKPVVGDLTKADILEFRELIPAQGRCLSWFGKLCTKYQVIWDIKPASIITGEVSDLIYISEKSSLETRTATFRNSGFFGAAKYEELLLGENGGEAVWGNQNQYADNAYKYYAIGTNERGTKEILPLCTKASDYIKWSIDGEISWGSTEWEIE